jgi:hypothetical protein
MTLAIDPSILSLERFIPIARIRTVQCANMTLDDAYRFRTEGSQVRILSGFRLLSESSTVQRVNLAHLLQISFVKRRARQSTQAIDALLEIGI